jgi:nicotinate-nucleotide adenylyltransferase
MKIGVFGGTFDPPHLAHLIFADEARWQLKLNRVLWLLTPVSPLKSDEEISPWEQRLELLEAALAGNQKFEVSRVDIHRPGPHYAYESMKILAGEYGGDELIYLIGEDSLRDLAKWEQPGELLRYCHQVGVMRRPDVEINFKVLEGAIPGIQSKLIWVESPLLEISGRMIRDRLKFGQPVRYFLPDAVHELIREKELYNFKNQRR